MNPTVGHGDKKESEAAHSAGYAPYPKLTPEDVAPASVAATTMPPESNPYIISSPAPAAKSMFDFPISISKIQWIAASLSRRCFLFNESRSDFLSLSIVSSDLPNFRIGKRDTMRDVLDKFGKRVNETAKKTEDMAGNFWQHCK